MLNKSNRNNVELEITLAQAWKMIHIRVLRTRQVYQLSLNCSCYNFLLHKIKPKIYINCLSSNDGHIDYYTIRIKNVILHNLSEDR